MTEFVSILFLKRHFPWSADQPCVQVGLSSLDSPHRWLVRCQVCQGISFLPPGNNWVGDSVFTACGGSGGTTTEYLFNYLPFELDAECSSGTHKTRPPGVVLSESITYSVSSWKGAVHYIFNLYPEDIQYYF